MRVKHLLGIVLGFFVSYSVQAEIVLNKEVPLFVKAAKAKFRYDTDARQAWVEVTVVGHDARHNKEFTFCRDRAKAESLVYDEYTKAVKWGSVVCARVDKFLGIFETLELTDMCDLEANVVESKDDNDKDLVISKSVVVTIKKTEI